MSMLKLITLSLLLLYTFSITAENLNYSSQLKELCETKGLRFFNHSIIKTVKGNAIEVIGISADLSKKQYNEFKGSPAVLITGAMHPREDTSFRFIKSAIEYIIKEFSQNNHQVRYLLSRVTLLIIPFVNIDAIKQSIQNPEANITLLRKNMNSLNTQKCEKAADKGVDINRNFDYNYGQLKSSQNPCNQEYRGTQPFSQTESQAIKILFQQFHVTTNIDVHSYGNIWIYPYASVANPNKIQQHELYPIYQHIFYEFDRQKIQYANCYESLKYIADGVYIDWALLKNSVSFALEFGDTFEKIGNELDKHIEALMIVVKINVDFFQYYLQVNEKDKRIDLRGEVVDMDKKDQTLGVLCIKSLSTLTHEIDLIIDGQSKEKKTIKSRQTQCFSQIFNFESFKSAVNSSKNSQNLPNKIKSLASNKKVEIKIKNSQILRQIELSSLKTQKRKNINTRPYYQSFVQSFKIFFIVVGLLYLIGSLCGLSIFFENALGVNIRQEQSHTFSDNQIIEMEESMETGDKIKKVQLKQVSITSEQTVQKQNKGQETKAGGSQLSNMNNQKQNEEQPTY